MRLYLLASTLGIILRLFPTWYWEALSIIHLYMDNKQTNYLYITLYRDVQYWSKHNSSFLHSGFLFHKIAPVRKDHNAHGDSLCKAFMLWVVVETFRQMEGSYTGELPGRHRSQYWGTGNTPSVVCVAYSRIVTHKDLGPPSYKFISKYTMTGHNM